MRKKVLLMGKSNSGKTSMRSIIFANYIARDTRLLGPTIDVEQNHVKFLSDLVLNLWDCGGQLDFMENFFTNQRQNIFRNVEVLIYVFDVNSRENRDLDYYRNCLAAILELSPSARVFCLVHKMDLIPEQNRDQTFNALQQDIERVSAPMAVYCFATSIWDETLYKAWSKIVYQLIPNVQNIERSLREFCAVIEADEVLLFERATFLEIASTHSKDHPDIHRFEKISNIVKQFKLSCGKVAANFNSMEIRNEHFASFIEHFTRNTYVMVVLSDPTISTSAILMNISNAKKQFDKIERQEQHPVSSAIAIGR